MKAVKLSRYRTALHVEGNPSGCYNRGRSKRFRSEPFRSVCESRHTQRERRMLTTRGEQVSKRGQVAQVVERSPEKAGVGGSTPSLATIFSIS